MFSQIKIGTMTAANRFVRSATHDFMANDYGTVSKRQLRLLSDLACGGAGLIIMGHAYIRKDGKCSPGMLGLDHDSKITGFARVAEIVHKLGNAKIAAQINFGGAQIPEEMRGHRLLSPSERDDVPEARAFTRQEADDIISAYIDAAWRAKEAGLDAVQIHAAHGYFLNQVLSPATNRRKDIFGDSVEGRALILKNIILGIRERLGQDFPILMKIASHDGTPHGLSLEDSVAVARMAVDWGLNAIEVSGGMRPGMNMRRPKKTSDEGFFLKEAEVFKNALSIPVISVHGFRSLSVMEEALSSGRADMISLCRPFIREPDLINRFKEGIQSKSNCISCNKCLKMRRDLKCRA